MQRNWYAIHTYSGHEKKVKINLQRRAETMGLSGKIYEILVPEEAEQQNRDGVKREIRKKVFPGYVLIDMVLDDTTWHLVKSTTGVTGFVSSGNKPVALQPHEVFHIKEALDPANAANAPKKIWEKGQVVRVTSGPFEDYTGKIDEVNDQKSTLRVLISLFGRDTPTELDFNQVEKI